ncbi:YqiA/YcfP family alpha/beta fold hydrolase [Pseudidiomarina atlantica]|jgi:predicted esterase YcpF (UPF0227 family)|uniref:YqiA/YcfP family alpha/beta fold hydrolase n=1 Tax=Pseudidiomarina atlantica TaxID=1517416 RepID=UPI000ABD83A1|nr:YqiA/YcfP family alpha/beta fold hydrolase [Pseudidiomarina atlantica]
MSKQPIIIFVHGFGSSGFGSKAEQMRAHCAAHDIRFFAPSLSHIPVLAWQTLSELVEQLNALIAPRKVAVMGSSLGGFYAHALACRYDLPVVLINPSMHAAESLRRALGTAINFHDNSPYEWRTDYLEQLEAITPAYPSKLGAKQCWLLTQTADEVLDYREALPALPYAKQTIISGGNHGFVGFEKYLDDCVEFFRAFER